MFRIWCRNISFNTSYSSGKSLITQFWVRNETIIVPIMVQNSTQKSLCTIFAPRLEYFMFRNRNILTYVPVLVQLLNQNQTKIGFIFKNRSKNCSSDQLKTNLKPNSTHFAPRTGSIMGYKMLNPYLPAIAHKLSGDKNSCPSAHVPDVTSACLSALFISWQFIWFWAAPPLYIKFRNSEIAET